MYKLYEYSAKSHQKPLNQGAWIALCEMEPDESVKLAASEFR
jgi:aromatic ring-opening dioxygenase catalytic subunit (LigB family)